MDKESVVELARRDKQIAKLALKVSFLKTQLAGAEKVAMDYKKLAEEVEGERAQLEKAIKTVDSKKDSWRGQAIELAKRLEKASLGK